MAAPEGRNIVAQGVSPGLNRPSPRLRHPSPARAGEGRGRVRARKPMAHAMGYGLAPASRADLCHKPLGQETSVVSQKFVP